MELLDTKNRLEEPVPKSILHTLEIVESVEKRNFWTQTPAFPDIPCWSLTVPFLELVFGDQELHFSTLSTISRVFNIDFSNPVLRPAFSDQDHFSTLSTISRVFKIDFSNPVLGPVFDQELYFSTLSTISRCSKSILEPGSSSCFWCPGAPFFHSRLAFWALPTPSWKPCKAWKWWKTWRIEVLGAVARTVQAAYNHQRRSSLIISPPLSSPVSSPILLDQK